MTSQKILLGVRDSTNDNGIVVASEEAYFTCVPVTHHSFPYTNFNLGHPRADIATTSRRSTPCVGEHSGETKTKQPLQCLRSDLQPKKTPSQQQKNMPENIWPDYCDKLAGGWKCITYKLFDGSGTDKKLIAKPHGDEPLGRVLISHNGYLSAHVARRDRMGALPSGKPWQLGEDKEVAYVGRGLSMYCGYLELFRDDEGLYWQTTVEVCSDPSRIGGKEERRAEYWEESGKAFMVLQPKQDMVTEVS